MFHVIVSSASVCNCKLVWPQASEVSHTFNVLRYSVGNCQNYIFLYDERVSIIGSSCTVSRFLQRPTRGGWRTLEKVLKITCWTCGLKASAH